MEQFWVSNWPDRQTVEFFLPEDIRVVLGSYTPGTWVNLRADLDYMNLEADLWMNGVLEVEDWPILPKEWLHPKWGPVTTRDWGLISENTYTGNVFFDDLRITPEPTTLVLLLLGGFALVKGRRLKMWKDY